MRYSGDLRDSDLVMLLASDTPDELHRALVLHPPVAGGREPSLAVALFRQVHSSDPDGVADSFVLLATDPRWANATGVTTALVDTGLVDDDVVDLVAEAFVAADQSVWWTCPDAWFDDEHAVEIEIGTGTAAGRPRDGTADDDEAEPGPTVTERRVPADARRWAAGRVLRRDPDRWPALHRRASEASSRVATGLWLGILDAIDSIGEPAAQVIERAALGAGHSSVRLAALRRMAQRDPEAAAALAAGDSNQRVRAQASTLGARVEPGETAGSAGPTSADPDRPTAKPEQPTLF